MWIFLWRWSVGFCCCFYTCLVKTCVATVSIVPFQNLGGGLCKANSTSEPAVGSVPFTGEYAAAQAHTMPGRRRKRSPADPEREKSKKAKSSS